MMTRHLPLVAMFLTVLSACAGPIETRIETNVAAPISSSKNYSFTETPEQHNETYKSAQLLVKSALSARGFAQSSPAPLLVHLSLADRPASIAITTGEEDRVKTITGAKARKPLQSCKDREHRLTIKLINQASGSIVYSGSAAEYHCKGLMKTSLPHLVSAALSDLGSSSAGSFNKTTSRRGIE